MAGRAARSVARSPTEGWTITRVSTRVTTRTCDKLAASATGPRAANQAGCCATVAKASTREPIVV